jgi:thymidylate kinase
MAAMAHPCRKPLIVEFAGMPGAGKTRTIELLDHFYRREGKSVRVITEGAQACPIGQEHRVAFAAWTAHRIVNVLLEEAYAPRCYDLLLLDRGLFDAQAFIQLLFLESKITENEMQTLLGHLRLSLWTGLTDLVLLLDVPPNESLRRHMSDSLTQRPGPILNEPTLVLLRSAYEDVAQFYGARRAGPVVQRLDASRDSPQRLAELCLPAITKALGQIAPKSTG